MKINQRQNKFALADVTGWWETVNSEYSDERFKQTFRVSREHSIFYYLK